MDFRERGRERGNSAFMNLSHRSDLSWCRWLDSEAQACSPCPGPWKHTPALSHVPSAAPLDGLVVKHLAEPGPPALPPRQRMCERRFWNLPAQGKYQFSTAKQPQPRPQRMEELPSPNLRPTHLLTQMRWQPLSPLGMTLLLASQQASP